MTMMPSPPVQLALALDHHESFARDDFLVSPANAAAVNLVDGWPAFWPSRHVVLCGPEKSGKSHLAAVWASVAGARFLAAHALTRAHPPEALATGALVLEDLAESEVDEAALFHLLNLAREQGDYVLITVRTPPAGWSFAVRDLASRLKALPVVHLAPPDDGLLGAVVAKLFADRQAHPDPGVIDYLTTRIERSFAAARAAVDRLDREALRRQRPVTRALAAELFRCGED